MHLVLSRVQEEDFDEVRTLVDYHKNYNSHANLENSLLKSNLELL